MRFVRLFALVMAPTALALSASCAPIGIFASDGFSGTGGGFGGSTYTSHTDTTTATGGSSGLDGGSITSAPSYLALCGGGVTCTPGAKDSCTQGGNPGMGGAPPDASKLSCRVIQADGGGIAAQCGTTGESDEGSSCSSSSDCGPEMGCVVEDTSSVCRSYCCASLESCPSGTYCKPEAMAGAGAPGNAVPVCVSVTSCQLLNPMACADGGTCAVVRQDGTASCVTPGSGTDGDPCPCAAGYTCSTFDNTCQKLCSTLDAGTCGPNQVCFSGTTGFPPNVGTCVQE
jgi:hypothetical protein